MPRLFLSRLVILTCVFAGLTLSQSFDLDINLELTAAKFNPNSDPERTINTNFRDDDPFNPVRGKLFPSYRFNQMFGIEGEFLFDNKAKRFDRSGNSPVRVDGLFLSVRGLLDRRLNFWFGKVPTPVGTFSARSYSHVNPLIGYPLAYHYKIPYNVFTLSPAANNLRLRDRNLGSGTAIYEACWITGVTAFGTASGVDYMVAIGRGTLTNPEASENKGFQVAGRIGTRFFETVRAGISAGIAPYLQHDTGLPQGTSVRDPKHVIVGIDASAVFGPLRLVAETFYNSWDTPQYAIEKSIDAFTWYLESQYFLLSNFYLAARLDQMFFSRITNPVSGGKTSWGYDLTRLEGGFGLSVIEQLNVKGVIQFHRLDRPSPQDITILGLQAAFRFDNVQELVGMGGDEPEY